jgi:hypothetical protein
MKRLLAAIVAALCISGEAVAATYYISPTGNDALAGTTFAARWKTINKANNTVQPGDLVLVYPGSYIHFPNPVTPGTGADRIAFVADTTSPTATRVPSGTLSDSYLTIAGFQIGGSLTFSKTAEFDTVKNCKILGDLALQCCRYSWLWNCDVMGQKFRVCKDVAGITYGGGVRYCRFPNLGAQDAGTTDYIGFGGGAPAGHVDSLTQQDCRFTIRIENNGADRHPQKWFLSKRVNTVGCRYDVTNLRSDNGSPYVFYVRDSSTLNVWRRDTILASGPGAAKVSFATSGAYPNTCDQNWVDSCFFKLDVTGDTFIGTLDRANRLKLTYNVFASRGGALEISDIKGNTTIDHNTFLGHPDHGIVEFGGAYPAWDDTVHITNNIFYSYGAAPVHNEWAFPGCRYVQGLGDYCGYNYALRIDPSLEDSVRAAGGGTSRKHVINYNLFAYYGDSLVNGDRSWSGESGGQFRSSYPGARTTITTPPVSWWFRGAKKDSASIYGSPLFVDSSLAAFNPALRKASAAIATGQGGSDIGARSYVGTPILSANVANVTFQVGGTQTFLVTLQNTGDGTVTVSSITSSGSKFTITGAPTTIAAGANSNFTIVYAGSASAASSSVAVNSDDPVTPQILISVVAYENGTLGD